VGHSAEKGGDPKKKRGRAGNRGKEKGKKKGVQIRHKRYISTFLEKTYKDRYLPDTKKE